MASHLKKVAEAVDSKKINNDTIYINTTKMNELRTKIDKDLDNIGKVFTNISKITKTAISKDAVKDSEEKYMKKIANTAAKREKACAARKTEVKNKLTSSIAEYKMALLENRVAELEAAIAKLASK